MHGAPLGAGQVGGKKRPYAEQPRNAAQHYCNGYAHQLLNSVVVVGCFGNFNILRELRMILKIPVPPWVLLYCVMVASVVFLYS